MPNLDNVFNKFFPKSKTAPMGKKLIYFAWGIEILVALVGLTMAMLFFFSKGQSGISADDTELMKDVGKNLDNYIVGLAFVVVAVMELTKIPLATACYYAAKWTWRTIFIVALIAVNYSTFETIIQGFELGYHNRLAIVDVELEKKQKLEKEIEDLITNNLNKSDQNQKINSEINELEDQKATIQSQKIDAINNIKKQHSISNNDVIIQLEKSKQSKEKERSEKEKSLDDLQATLVGLNKSQGECPLVGRKKCQNQIEQSINSVNKRISSTQNRINLIDKEITSIDNKISKLTATIDGDIIPLIEAEEEKARIAIDKIQNLIDQKRNELGNVQSSSSSENYLADLEILKKELVEQEEILVKTARQNQIYRIAKFIKNTGSNMSAWWNNKTAEEYKLTDIDQSDTDLAFMLWFGGLALVISIIGTLVALAGLHLQDERMHEIRNKPIKARLGRFFRNIAWIPIYINKYIWAGVKRLKDPKIVKEKVEVEVEKIIEKPIFKDKVVYVDQEVPRETIIEKKEMVYVPLPTDDEELLKKGPFKAPDYDKDKKK